MHARIFRRNLKVSNEDTGCCMSFNGPTIAGVLIHCMESLHYGYVEMVQHRAVRYVTNRYHNTSSVTSMLDHLEWETLEARLVKCQLTTFFEIVNGLVDTKEILNTGFDTHTVQSFP